MRRASVILALALVASIGCDDAHGWVELSAADSVAADAALARGAHDEAAAALARIVERPVPSSVAAEDARIVRQDASERWARLSLERGDPQAALERLDQGLALGERGDVFTANLLTLRARVLEAQGRDGEAAADYHRALLIEETLLERALGGVQ